MVLFKVFRKKSSSQAAEQYFLSVVDNETDEAQTGTYFRVHKSLRRPNGVSTSINQQSFPSEMSKPVEGHHDASSPRILKSCLRDYHDRIDQFPMLGRDIISGSVHWGSHSLKVPGEAIFIEGYWEWTEDILSRFSERLELSSLRSAVYASLYSYDKDPDIFRAFCEGWCPSTNTLHTMIGEWSISLWDLYKIGGLPVVGEIYDETVPHVYDLHLKDQDGKRAIPQACEFLFAAYHHLNQSTGSSGCVTAKQWIDFWFKKARIYKAPNRRRRYVTSRPKNSQDPNGNIDIDSTSPSTWNKEEQDMFGLLGIAGSVRRDTTFVAAFLSCWLCVFVLPQTSDRVIRPGTFEIATLMAQGVEFSLAIPVLASIYRGLNHISKSTTPYYSKCSFPAHYLYGWLAFYFKTHHDLDPVPPGPPMVIYSGAQGSKYFEKDSARELLHEGHEANIGCTILNRNRQELLHDDGNLETSKLSYIMSLRSCFLVLRRGEAFHVEPYLPHRFGRQFGFCQDIPGLFRRDTDNRSVGYYDALRYWSFFLYKGSNSRLLAPAHSLDWQKLITSRFNTWWMVLNVKDLRKNFKILSSSVDHKISKARVVDDVGVPQSANKSKNDVSPHDRTVRDLDVHAPSKKDKSKVIRDNDHYEEGSLSDAESDVNFKHKRQRILEPTDVPKINLDPDSFFMGVPESSQPSPDLHMGGDLNLEVTEQNDLGNSMIEEANHTPAPKRTMQVPGKGKELRSLRDLKDKQVSCSPVGSFKSIEGPLSLTAAAKTSGIQHEQKSSPLVRPVSTPTNSASTIQFTAASRSLFDQAIKTFGVEFLKTLKATPFDEVPNLREVASTVYQGIERLKGDPKPLKLHVESYITTVESYLKLKQCMASRQRSDQVEQAKLLESDKFAQIRSSMDASLTKQKALEEEGRRFEEEMEQLRQKANQTKTNLEAEKALFASLEAEANSSQRRLGELEEVPSWSAEDLEEFDEHEKQVMAFQLSVDNFI